MIIPGEYKGSKVILRSKEGAELACTEIKDHDKVLDVITVEGVYEEAVCDEQVLVLIVTKSTTHEYNGTIRRVVNSTFTTEIALYNGKIRENRAAERYTINTKGWVQSMAVNASLIPLPAPIDIFIVNLSSVGALFRAKPDSFAINAVIEMNFAIGANDSTMFGKIIRRNVIDVDTEEYGCRFIFIK